VAARRASSHSALRAAPTHASAPAGKPHIFQNDPGVLTVTCGHCATTYTTDSDGHAEHHCFGCCADHQEEQ